MKKNLADVIQAIKNERDYQDRKWGSIEEHPHTVGEWLLICESELQEAKEAWCKGRGDEGALLELLQVIAVGAACLQQHGIVEREPARPVQERLCHRCGLPLDNLQGEYLMSNGYGAPVAICHRCHPIMQAGGFSVVAVAK